MSADAEITLDEFVRRFTDELVRIVGPTYRVEDDPEPERTADYAAQVAPTYYDEPDQRCDGPEECARTDYSYWED